MNKEKFLELAGQIYDSTKMQTDKVSVSKVVLEEIIDRISTEVSEGAEDLIDDYTFGIRCGNEIQVEDVSIDHYKVVRIVKEVLDEYFIAGV